MIISTADSQERVSIDPKAYSAASMEITRTDRGIEVFDGNTKSRLFTIERKQ